MVSVKRTIKISKSEEKNKEFDAVGVSLDQSTVYLCYVKTTLRDKDIDLFQEELKEFRTFFPEYKGKKLVGILASMNYSDELFKLYKREGFLYIAPAGYALEIKNEKISNQSFGIYKRTFDYKIYFFVYKVVTNSINLFKSTFFLFTKEFEFKVYHYENNSYIFTYS